MSIRRYNPIDGIGDLETFKREARLLQLAAGVDPKQCLEIVECEEVGPDLDGLGGRTPVQTYLAHIAVRQYPTPPRKVSRWREHDEALHLGNVVAVHPKIAEVYAEFATIGLEDEQRSIIYADALDGSLGSNVRCLLALFRVSEPKATTWQYGSMVLTRDKCRELADIDDQHIAKIWSIELPLLSDRITRQTA